MDKTKQSYIQIVIRQFRKNNLAMGGLFIIVFLFVVAIFANILANNKPIILRYNEHTYFPAIFNYKLFALTNFKELELSKERGDFAVFPPIRYSPREIFLEERLNPPSLKHILGTDDKGRDLLSRLIHGSRTSLSVGFVAVFIYVIIGVILGAIAGFYGGRVDMIISRFIEVMICFPTFFLIIAVLAFISPSIYNIMIVIGLTGWTSVARLIRGEILKVKTMEYIMAAKSIGASDFREIVHHLLPNSLSSVLVTATFGVARAIIVESALSFLGFGVPPPTPSWGEALFASKQFAEFAWWLTLFPGIAIFITVTAYNLAGEGLRDAMDPRLKG